MDIVEPVVARLNSLVQCGCIDEEWPLLRHDTVHLIDARAAEITRLRSHLLDIRNAYESEREDGVVVEEIGRIVRTALETPND